MILLTLVIVHLVAIVTAGSSNQFIFPSIQDFDHSHVDGSFAVGTAITIQWTTIWETVTLVIWQDGPLPFQYLPNSGLLVNTTSFAWTVNLSGTGQNPNFDLSAGQTFFFGIFHTGTTDVFESQYINITRNAASSAPSSSSVDQHSDLKSSTASSTNSIASSTNSIASSTNSIASSTSSIASSTISIASSTSSTPPTSSTSSQSAEGLSMATKTGISVGVGIGVFALAAGFGTGYFAHRRKQASAATPHLVASEPPLEMLQSNEPAELPQERPELPGHPLKPTEPIFEI